MVAGKKISSLEIETLIYSPEDFTLFLKIQHISSQVTFTQCQEEHTHPIDLGWLVILQ